MNPDQPELPFDAEPEPRPKPQAEPWHARSTDPSTSHAQAARAAANSKGIDAAIMAMIKAHGPLNTREISELTGIPRVSVSPRPCKMAEAGLLKRLDEKRNGGLLWDLVT